MAKQIIAVTGEYQKQDGTQGANFAEIGVVMTSQNGRDYALLDPTINLAGILLKQNALAAAKGEQPRDMVMCSVKERQQGNNAKTQQGYNQEPQQRQPPAQQGYQPRQSPQHGHGGYSDEIPI